MKRITLIVAALLGIISTSFAQNCDLNKNIITANTLCDPIKTALNVGNYELKARDGIVLQPGFKLTATPGHTFTAKIDNSVANQLTGYVSSTVNTTIVPALDKSNCIPGTIGGSIDVSPTRAATYQLPIQVSPGSHGIQPNLSIVYSSQGGNGLLGWGWNLAGLSSISRASKNIYYDENFDAISLTSTDALALDGVRLISSGAAGTYYPANNPYTNVVLNNNSFTVTTQDGVVMEYGKEGNSLVMVSGSSAPISWAINRMTDPEGNYIDFIYAGDQTSGEYRISEINYTGNSNSGKAPYNSVKFYYDKRTDTNSMYFAGEKIPQTVLLTSIKVFSEGILSKDYEFTYFTDQYSKLHKISLTADGVTYNSTSIIWNQAADHNTTLVEAGMGSLRGGQWFFGNIDGDGVLDKVLFSGSGNLWVKLSDGNINHSIPLPQSSNQSGSSGNTSITVEINDIKILDWDNNGYDDIIVHYSVQTCSGSYPYPTKDDICNGYERVIAFKLFQGSFQSNIISHYNTCEQVQINRCYPCKRKFFYADINNDGSVDQLILYGATLVGANGLNLNTIPPEIGIVEDIKFIDFNSDGRVDILFIKSDGNGSIWTYNGSNLVQLLNTRFITKKSNFFFPGDFNGDGKTDYIGRSSSDVWMINYSTGTSYINGLLPAEINNEITSVFNPSIEYKDLVNQPKDLYTLQTKISPVVPISVDDMNNDGKSDILMRKEGKIVIFLSKGESFSLLKEILTDDQLYIFSVNVPKVLYAIDINADGQKEILYGSNRYYFKRFNSSVVPPKGDLVYQPSYNYAEFEPFRLITFNSRLDKELFVGSIVDGLNSVSTFTYSNYSDNRPFGTSFPKPAYPLMLLRGPMQVASNMTTKNGSTEISNTTYTFQDAYMHIQGAGFLGFKTVTSYNSVNLVSSVSNFEYTIPGATGVYSPWLKSQTTSKKGISISSVTNTMGVKKFDVSKKSFMPIVTSSSTTDHLRVITTKTEITTFDEALGRVTDQTTLMPGWTISTSTPYVKVSGYVSKPLSVTTTRTNKNGSFSSTTTIDYESGSSMRVIKKTEAGVETTYSGFDGYGNPQDISVKDKSITRNTSCTFEGKGRFIISSTNAIGNTTTSEYRPSDGVKLWEQTANGRTTYSYSAQGGALVTTATYPDGNISTSRVGWDNSGYAYYSQKSITNGNTATTYFNALGQKVKETSFGFKGALLTAIYTYNADGTLLSENLPGVSTPNAYSYWDDGRLKEVKGHNSSTISYSYSGTKVTTTSSVSGTEDKIYDALGNITDITSPNGTMFYDYDPSGKVKSITAAGSESSMTYDPVTLDQLTLTDPDAGTTTYTYNGFGLIATQKDNKQQKTTCSYNTVGQILTKTGSGIDESYTYYGSEAIEKRGLLKTATRNGITETYDYDNLGRKISTITTGAGKTFTTTYQYDTEKRLGVITYQPIGISLKYGYDAVGNLQYIYRLKADNSTTLIWEGKTKNDREQWTEFAMSSGLITTKWGYDATKYTLNSVQTGISGNPTGIQNLGFTFNEKGQLKNRTDNSLSESFDYDPQNRLTFSTVLGQATYSTGYEVNGNINSTTLAGIYNYKVTGKPHAVSSIDGPTGATGQSPSVLTTSTFTGDNKLADMNNGTYKNAFTYGPSGNRFKVDHYQNSTLVSSKIYVGSCEYVLDNSGNITTSRMLITAPTGICAVWEKVGAAEGALHYIHTDYLGSWLKITDGNGALENSYSYDAWGRPRDPNTWELLPVSITDALTNLSAMQPRFDRGYTGHEIMAGFGLINMNGRLYDPYLQRFLSPDNYVQSPLNAQNYNRYTYCLNNPLMYTDPDGE